MIRKQTQRGFSLVTAIFLLAVIAGLGLAVTLMSGTQHVSFVQDIQGVKAHFAARSGVEYGVAKVINEGWCGTDSQTIDGFSVAVNCSASGPISEAASSYQVYTLVARASQGAKSTSSLINRTLRVTFKNP